jgi:intermediate peptidase
MLSGRKDILKRHTFRLKSLFDSESHHLSLSKNPSGLFQYQNLVSPQSFIDAAQKTIQRSNGIVDQVCSATEPLDRLKAVKRLDYLSDLLCSVVDAAQLVQHVHPDPDYARASAEAYSILSNYLNQLNTNSELYHVRLFSYIHFLIGFEIDFKRS